MNRIRSAGLPWSTVLSSLGVLLAAVLLIAPTLLWYALARTSFVQWGIISTSTINTMQLVLILLLAKDNPLWLPVAIVGRVQISRILERYGYEVTSTSLLVMLWSVRVRYMEIHLSLYKHMFLQGKYMCNSATYLAHPELLVLRKSCAQCVRPSKLRVPLEAAVTCLHSRVLEVNINAFAEASPAFAEDVKRLFCVWFPFCCS